MISKHWEEIRNNPARNPFKGFSRLYSNERYNTKTALSILENFHDKNRNKMSLDELEAYLYLTNILRRKLERM